jgi:Tfp pilus assembly PilM family ATPase
LDLGEERAVLCLLSERGPVVVRYLDVGSSAIVERLRRAGVAVPDARAPLKASREDADTGPVAEACREVVRRAADEIRMSLAFYRSEYDRESLPRYLLSGWARVPRLNRWLTDELRLDSPFEVIDPFQAIRVTAARGETNESAGPEFVQAFGLALRAL